MPKSKNTSESSPTKEASPPKTYALIAIVVVIFALLLPLVVIQFHSSSSATSHPSSSPPAALPFFNVSSPLSTELDAAAPSPTVERSAEVASYIYNGSATLLSYGTRVAGATNKGRRRALRFFRNFVRAMENETTRSNRNNNNNNNGFTWTAREDQFSENTVIGPKQFTNFVLESQCRDDDVSKDDKNNKNENQKHLVIAGHWDSKLFKDFEFVGACDSAIPVVMMMRLARQVTSFYLHHDRECSSLPKITFMFLDGEEAFVDWVGNDNTYGSRHLANLYEKEGKLKSISLFMLLDLLGPKNPQFWNYFPDKTGEHFKKMQKIEKRQRDKDKLRRTSSPKSFFSSRPHHGGVDDDHRPWMQKGVPILHMIPLPFPPEWHKKGDTIDTIDFNETVVDLYNIVSEFILTF